MPNIQLMTEALFASLIIRIFQLVFSAGIVFFSHSKSAGTVFRLVFSAKRTRARADKAIIIIGFTS